MTDQATTGGMSRRICRWILASAAWLVPSAIRADWRREWEAELWVRRATGARRTAAGARGRIVRECSGAIADALVLSTVGCAVETFVDDLAAAARAVAAAPAATATAALVLGIGVGTASVTLGVSLASWHRPSPYAASDDLVRLQNGIGSAWRDAPLSRPEFHELASHGELFERVGAAAVGPGALATRSGVEHVRVATVSADFFPTLGCTPVLGTLPTPASRGVVLRHDVWRRVFSSDPNVIGRLVMLGEDERVVRGIVPEGIDLPFDTDVWVVSDDVPGSDERDRRNLVVVARLRDGVTREQARDALGDVSRASFGPRPRAPGGEPTFGLDVVPVIGQHAARLGWSETVLRAIAGLLVAVAVVGAARRLRGGLAGRVRTRQIAAGLAAGAGGAVGALGAAVTLRSVDASGAGIATLVAAVALVAVVATAVLGTRARARSVRRRPALVLVHVALTAVLVAVTAMSVRDVDRTTSVLAGFDARDRQSCRIALTDAAYDPAARARFVGGTIERLDATGGIDDAAAVSLLPLRGRSSNSVATECVSDAGSVDAPEAEVRSVTSRYFSVMGIAVNAGRSFVAEDRDGAPLVAIVNDTFVRRFLAAGVDPIGVRIRVFTSGGSPWRTIVGVVGSVRQVSLADEALPEVYVPYAQTPSVAVTFVARTSLPPSSVASVVGSLDPRQPVFEISSLADVVNRAVADRRLFILLLTVCAAAALALAVLELVEFEGRIDRSSAFP